ncbi:MAG: hypothetical protein CL678_03720 [Bdellovibrionaceae bacterium]|nr:hypothetical protein [Pseudobdellovibrionaceae bacterium]|tara:strand:- start:1438 stop:2232 length:795 start_codon:yes stop_codon:yes gene_type:complete
MIERDLTWEELKTEVSNHLKEQKGPVLCRGQADSSWGLRTSFHRIESGFTFVQYFEIVKSLADFVGTYEKRTIDVVDAEVNGSFLAYLQHHGFPTPLLDWSHSPYIALFFAFSEITPKTSETGKVSLWVFNYLKWTQTFRQTYDYTDTTPHVSILRPKSMGNERQLIQQGNEFMFTNVDDIAGHIQENEKGKGETYMEKYNLSVKERNLIMEELEVMGINRFSLFRTTDALCSYLKESLFRSSIAGGSPAERLETLVKGAKKTE